MTPHEQYGRLGRRADARREAYRALFRAVPEEDIADRVRQATNGGFVLGSARFAAEIAHALGRRVERGMSGRPPQKRANART